MHGFKGDVGNAPPSLLSVVIALISYLLEEDTMKDPKGNPQMANTNTHLPKGKQTLRAGTFSAAFLAWPSPVGCVFRFSAAGTGATVGAGAGSAAGAALGLAAAFLRGGMSVVFKRSG